MSVRHAILGILLRRPTYPYELVLTLERLLGETWQLNQGQVYLAIKKLEYEGFIEGMKEKPNKHGRKRSYRVTDKGRREFEHWQGSTSDRLRPLREDVLLKIALSADGDAHKLLEVIEERKKHCEGWLRYYEELESALVDLDKTRSFGEAGQPLSVATAKKILETEMDCLEMARCTVERLVSENDTRVRKA